MLQTIRIDNILGGINPTQFFGVEGGYNAGIAIDPDFPVADSGAANGIRPSGLIRPVAYEAFDGAAVDATPLFILTNPKDAKVYVHLSNGALISYSSSLGSESDIGTVTGGGGGAAYYNNYLYFSQSGTDLTRYGPLDGSPSLATGVWTGATLGSQTQMRNTTYPTIRGSVSLPNHPMHVHIDGQLYIGDFDSGSSTDTTRGKGLIHAVKTKYGSAEGDTDDGSAYNVLDLPFGYMPTAIQSYGTFLAILAIKTPGNTLERGKSAMFLWDTISETFHQQVDLPDVMGTAMLNVNGSLFVWAGKLTATGGYSLYQYSGGYTFTEIVTFGEGHPPTQGAVDSNGGRLVWGSWVTYPENAAVVWAYGSKDRRVPSGLHCIARATASASSTDGLVSALRFAEQASNARPQMVLGWRDASNHGLDKLSTTYQTSVWRSSTFRFNKPFTVKQVRIPFGQAIAANMTITPTIYVDNEAANEALPTINNTNYSGKLRAELTAKIRGETNFFLDLSISGTALSAVALPIEIDVDVMEN